MFNRLVFWSYFVRLGSLKVSFWELLVHDFHRPAAHPVAEPAALNTEWNQNTEGSAQSVLHCCIRCLL